MLKPGQRVSTGTGGLTYEVDHFLGGGGQGEVYRASTNGNAVALKWYLPDYLRHDTSQRMRLERAVGIGPPTPNFLWPLSLAFADALPGFGYVMPLREPRFKGIQDLMRNRVQPTFEALASAGYELADSFHQLHARGLCYRDISFGNVFFDPNNGHVRICDNDNVEENGSPRGGIAGTPRFMAPEIVRGEASPNTETDQYSLAVLLFYMFMIAHPLDGRRESAIRCMDLPAMEKLYGREPLFIFDPQDGSNAPDSRYHLNALTYWPIYPRFLQQLFEKSFTTGLHDPQHGRVPESQWRLAMIRLRDSIVYCANCSAENFYDHERKGLAECWHCKQRLHVPPHIRLGKTTVHQAVVMLNHNTRLYGHHVDRPHDFDTAVAEVAKHPTNPTLWGIRNLTNQPWTAVGPDGVVREVPPGRSVSMTSGTRILFGNTEGVILV